ncbi:ABC transporter permease [Dyella silvatica]|uniref:ABC transporter permease n=1 Tax=Dyella silvatica TaxID=2992128 RepID=UPI002257DA62|nr:ABC transporter permease [Dyella silvatica]
MIILRRALSAEALKLRHTLGLWLIWLAPLVIIVLTVVQFSFQKTHGPMGLTPVKAWMNFCRGIFTIWCVLMLPLFVTLQAALLAGLEHGNQQWKHLLALPVPHWSHYAAKALMLALMVVASTLLLCVMTPLVGWILMYTKPDYGVAWPAPWGWLLMHSLECIAASSLLVGLHTWVAIRWNSFTTAIGVGVAGTVAGFLICQSEKLGPWFPWSMAAQTVSGNEQRAMLAIVVSLIGGALTGAIGLWDYARREYA